MAEILNDENFVEKTSKGITLVDFYADWCAPCKMMSPIVDELSKEKDDVDIYKVNVEESSNTSTKFGIRSIPTFVVLKDGKEVSRKNGKLSKEELTVLLDNV